MYDNYVGFPGFGLKFNIDPVAFNLFGKNIYWYGIIIASGLILALFLCVNLGKKYSLPKDAVTDIVLYGTPVAIICARLYYVIFKFSDYKDNLADIIKIWEGGLAIYGGVIGAVITAYVYCRVKKISFLKTADILIIGVLLGQAIGRWGNFVNKEAFGGLTDLPWRMEIYNGISLVSVHPTFLYESIWNLIGVLVLLFVNKRKKKDGEVFFSYFVWYGIGRYFIEGLRTDSLYLGNFRISQIVAVITAVAGIIVLIYTQRTKKTD